MKINSKVRNLIVTLLIITSLFSCAKEEGEGGKNSIEGVVLIQEYSTYSNEVQIEYLATEERVYIVYGDNAYFADEARTNYNGVFKFPYLYKGNYQIFVYSECIDCPSGVEPVIVDIELVQKREEFQTDTLYIKKYID